MSPWNWFLLLECLQGLSTLCGVSEFPIDLHPVASRYHFKSHPFSAVGTDVSPRLTLHTLMSFSSHPSLDSIRTGWDETTPASQGMRGAWGAPGGVCLELCACLEENETTDRTGTRDDTAAKLLHIFLTKRHKLFVRD